MCIHACLNLKHMETYQLYMIILVVVDALLILGLSVSDNAHKVKKK